MKFTVEINILPHDGILDPSGKAINQNLNNIGVMGVENVRVGRYILLTIDAESKENAILRAEEACDKLLINKVMEKFSITVRETELV